MEGSYSIYSLARNILLILLLYTSSITLISAIDKTYVEFIRTSCGLTPYPTLCFNSLSTQADAIQTSPKLLVQTALSVSLDTTLKASSEVRNLLKSQVEAMTPKEVAAVKNCIELLNDLKRSLGEMSQPGSIIDVGQVTSYTQKWVSSALTGENACSQGFVKKLKIKSLVTGEIVDVGRSTTNALALWSTYGV